jgi:hypothetical protein
LVHGLLFFSLNHPPFCYDKNDSWVEIEGLAPSAMSFTDAGAHLSIPYLIVVEAGDF